MDKIRLEFLNPNSINNHWGHSRYGAYIKPKGKLFRKHVLDVVTDAGYKDLKLECRLKYRAIFHPGSAHKTDIDNFCTKTVFDALTNSGIFVDDSQIDDIAYVRGEIIRDKINKGGKIIIELSESFPEDLENIFK